MNDDLFLDLDADAPDDLRIKFDGVTYTIVEPNLIQWDAIGKSLQKMGGLGALVSDVVTTIVGDEKTDEGVLSRLLQNADSISGRLFEVMGNDFFDGMTEACVAVLMTPENVDSWVEAKGLDAAVVDEYARKTKSKLWKENTMFGSYLRQNVNLRQASGILRAAWQQSGVFDAMGKLLMSQVPKKTEEPEEEQ